MYKTGHWGAALLVWAPVGGAFALGGRVGPAVLGGAGMLALARLPDYDMRVPGLTHRGPTHTVGFALLVGAVVGAGAATVAGSAGVATGLAGGFGALVGTLAILSHVLADALTPAGVTPFWPLSARQYSLSLVTADSTVANYALLALGVFVSVAVLAVTPGLSRLAGA